MDFMRVLDQTVREIKREVNLKVLKVPEIEQKVLDATNDEPWGPHGTILSEIAQATKKFTECQLIMNVLWTRLTDTGPNWRHVYKALTVIEYLVANGSERSVDDILEHTLQISANSGFEYVEPNGKDVGINVRKKAETILALLNDREKIQAVRDKATANRDKFVGLSSTGMTYKSSSTSYGSSSFHNSDHYGSLNGSREGDSFRDSYKEGEQYGKESNLKNENKDSENNASKWKRQVARNTRNQDSIPFNSSKILNKPGVNPSSKSPNAQPNSEEDEFDDFNPRGSSGSANANVNQVDLFGQSLVGDLMDAEPSILPKTTADHSTANSEVDLFADATFQSAPQAEAISDSHSQGNINLFASQPAFPSNVDLFAVPDTGLPAETKSAETINTESFDPFAAIPVNNFDGSDPFSTFASHAEPVTTAPSPNSTNTSPNNPDDDSAFGAFTSHAGQTIPEPSQNSSKSSLDNLKSSLTTSAPAARKDNFQVKSGIWADCLSRGLIDLNISAPKKVNLADIGIVGGLEDASVEKEKVPPTAFVGRAMGAGSGIGWSGFSTATGGSGSFSAFGQQQFGNFK